MEKDQYIVKVLDVSQETHNVRRIRVEKPDGYRFVPGQATEVSLNHGSWVGEKRPFTFTSLNEWPYLEFTIKTYTDHHGVTNEIAKLQVGDALILRDVWGAIAYKGTGVFLAAGAGITPFIAILRSLNQEGRISGNTLFFSNKTSKDIILQEELRELLGQNYVNIITDEITGGSDPLRMDEEFLRKNITDFDQNFYVCGPPSFTSDIQRALEKLGAKTDALVFEK